MREWMHRLLGTLRPARRDGDLEEELRLHLELAEEDAGRRGLSAGDSARAARLEAGGPSQTMDALRDQRGLPWLDDLSQDVRYGWRTLRRSQAWPALMILRLNRATAPSSVVRGAIFRPLVYPKPAVDAFDRAVPSRRSTESALPGTWNSEMNQPSRIGAFTTEVNIGGGAGSWAGEVNHGRQSGPRVRSAAVDAPPGRARRAADARTLLRPRRTDMAARSGEVDRRSRSPHESKRSADSRSSVKPECHGRLHDVIGIMPPGVDLVTVARRSLPIGVHPVIRQIRNSHVWV
jgi:hypothetical protein